MATSPLEQIKDGPEIYSPSFRNQWLNFTIYFLQFKFRTKKDENKSKYCAFLLNSRERLRKNDNPIGGNQKSNHFLANGKYFRTDFIQVDKKDIVKMLYDYPEVKGYSYKEAELNGKSVSGNSYYKSIDTNTDNKPDGVNNMASGFKYFFRGLFQADCLQFLVKMSII